MMNHTMRVAKMKILKKKNKENRLKWSTHVQRRDINKPVRNIESRSLKKRTRKAEYDLRDKIGK